MKRIFWGILFTWVCSSSLALVPKQLMETTEENRYLLGLGIQFLVPNQLTGFENSQMVFCPRVYLPIFKGHLQLGASYGTDSGVYPRLDRILIAEMGYRLGFETRFFSSSISVGAQYSHYQSALGNFKQWGPHLAWGIILPLARDFRMGLELRALQLEKAVLGFGGNFTFAL